MLHPLITDDTQALQALAWGVAEMDRRAQQRRTSPRIFFLIDEAQELLVREEYSKLLTDLTGAMGEVASAAYSQALYQVAKVAKVEPAVTAALATWLSLTRTMSTRRLRSKICRGLS